MTRRRSALTFGGGAVVFDSPACARRGGASPERGVEPERGPGRRGRVPDRRGTGLGGLALPRSPRLAPATTGTGHEWIVFSDSVFQDTYEQTAHCNVLRTGHASGLVLSMSPGLPQTFRDRIAGLLTDELKAVVTGATVTLTNVGFACLAMLGTTHKEKL